MWRTFWQQPQTANLWQAKKIGIAQAYFGAGLDDEVEKSIRTALAKYEELGAQIVEVDITDPAITLATYYLLAPAEASSNLSRYDGVRFGYRCENPKDLHDLYTRSRSEGFGAEVQRRIIMGTYAYRQGILTLIMPKPKGSPSHRGRL